MLGEELPVFVVNDELHEGFGDHLRRVEVIGLARASKTTHRDGQMF